MPGRTDDEEKESIEKDAAAGEKKGLSARLEAASNKGKMDAETMKLAWDAKKGGGAEGGAGRSVGSSQPSNARDEEEAEKKKQALAAQEAKEKEKKRVEGEHKRNHDLAYEQRYRQYQQERGR